MTRHDSDSGPACGILNTKNILSHHFHDWVTGYASHSLCSDWGSMVSYSTVPAWPTSARLTGLIKSRNSAYMGLNQQPQGRQPNAYTHQTTVVVTTQTNSEYL